MTPSNDTRMLLQAVYTMFQRSGDLMFVKDMRLVYLAVSKGFAEMVGLDDPAQAVGKTDFELFQDARLAEQYRADDTRLLENGEPLLQYIEPLPWQDGRARFVSTSKYALTDENGTIVGLYGIGREVTREMEAKQNYERELRYLFELPKDALSAVLFDVTLWVR